MSKIGTGELLVILIVALVIFGPSKLPALGKMAGKAIGSVRRYTSADRWEEFLDDEDDEEEEVVKPKKKKAAKKPVEQQEEEPAAEEAAEEPAAEEETA